MVDRQTMGPVQVFTMDVPSLNMALRDLSERLDELKGLRGRSMIYDRTRVDDPAQAQDAVTLDATGVSTAEQRANQYTTLLTLNPDRTSEQLRDKEEAKRYALLVGTGI